MLRKKTLKKRKKEGERDEEKEENMSTMKKDGEIMRKRSHLGQCLNVLLETSKITVF